MRTRSRLAFVAPVAAALLLAACGSDSNSSSDTTAAPASEAPASAAPAAAGTIVEVASANPDFSTLVTAVTAAGLGETLSGEGPFTVFAPTNDAFAAVDPAVLKKLLANKEALTKVLTYHVLSGKVMAADVKPGEVTTVEGSPATITVDGGTVKINDATVVATDVAASNGVIHVIDAVILPPDLDLASL